MFTGKTKERASYIVKISGTCNLGCPYCYYFKNKSRTANSTMSFDLLEKFLREAPKQSRQIEVIWHGGEPLTAGIDIFKKAKALQRQIEQEFGVRFRNLLQTNATLVSQEWADFFVAENFGIGVSLDGTEELHNQHRLSLSHQSTFNKTLRGIDILKKNNVPISVLCVVTKKSLNYAQKIYKFFTSGLSLDRFDFLPMVELPAFAAKTSNEQTTRNFIPGSLEQGDFYRFMKDIFDVWWHDNDPNISVRFLDNVLIGLLGKQPTSCTFNGSCGEYTTLDTDGTLLPCDNFIEYKNLSFGNMYSENLGDLLGSSKRLDYIRQVSQVHTTCSSCKFLEACGGGCRKYNFFLNHNFSDENYFCGDRWQIFNYVEKQLIQDYQGNRESLKLVLQENLNQNKPGANILKRLSTPISYSEMHNSLGRNTWNQGDGWDRWSEWDRNFPPDLHS